MLYTPRIHILFTTRGDQIKFGKIKFIFLEGLVKMRYSCNHAHLTRLNIEKSCCNEIQPTQSLVID